MYSACILENGGLAPDRGSFEPGTNPGLDNSSVMFYCAGAYSNSLGFPCEAGRLHT